MLRKIGKVWHYQAKINGKTKSWTTGETSKRQAEKKVPELMREAQLLREQPRNSPRLHRAIVEEVARIEEEIGANRAKRSNYAFVVFAKWIGEDADLKSIDMKMLKDYMLFRVKAGKARATIAEEIGLVRRLLKNNGFAVAKPKMIAAHRTKNRRFSDDELRRFFAAATDRFRPLWLILLATGCRLSDMVPSTESAHDPVLKSEVVLSERIVYVRPSKMKPNEEPLVRPVRISEEMVPVFEAQMVRTKRIYPFLFEMLWKEGRSFDATLRRAGLEKKTPQGKLTIHSFRATYLSKMGEALNGNAWLLKEIAGHKDIRTTQGYCQPEIPVIQVNMLSLISKEQTGQENTGMGVSAGCKAMKMPALKAG